MPEFYVAWAIDINADTPEEAARKARAVQLNPESIADVFTVLPHGGDEDDAVLIDLSEIDGRDVN